MSLRKVYGVFDDGTQRTLPSRLLVPEDGTINDAIDAFNKNLAHDVWSVSSSAGVEVVGFVSEKEVTNREASVWPVSKACKLNEVLEPNDCLVFRSAPEQDVVVKLEDVEDDTASCAKVATEEDQSDEKAGDAKEDENDSAVKRDVPARNKSKRSSMSLELRGLQDYLPSIGQRRSKRRVLLEPQHDSSVKKTRVCNKDDKIKPTSSSSPHTRKTSASSVGSDKLGSQHDGEYAVGTRHFCKWTDGLEYPVKIQNPRQRSHLMCNERIITFQGYGARHRVNTEQLLPATSEREARFQKAMKETEEQRRQQKEKRLLKEEEFKNGKHG